MIEYSRKILDELSHALLNIENGKPIELANAILQTKRIFVAGAGRSGLAMKSFAMRLMHLGFNAYVVGETITPSISASDLLIIGSGSGQTDSLILTAKTGKRLGTRIALITAKKNSLIGELADIEMNISAPTKQQDGEFQSIQPMGTLFEQSLLLSLDAIILILMEKVNKDSEEMFKSHANIE